MHVERRQVSAELALRQRSLFPRRRPGRVLRPLRRNITIDAGCGSKWADGGAARRGCGSARAPRGVRIMRRRLTIVPGSGLFRGRDPFARGAFLRSGGRGAPATAHPADAVWSRMPPERIAAFRGPRRPESPSNDRTSISAERAAGSRASTGGTPAAPYFKRNMRASCRRRAAAFPRPVGVGCRVHIHDCECRSRHERSPPAPDARSYGSSRSDGPGWCFP